MSMELGVMSNQSRSAIRSMCSQVRERTPKKLGMCMIDIMWPINQSHFHVSCLCSLKWNLFIVILV